MENGLKHYRLCHILLVTNLNPNDSRRSSNIIVSPVVLPNLSSSQTTNSLILPTEMSVSNFCQPSLLKLVPVALSEYQTTSLNQLIMTAYLAEWMTPFDKFQLP
jgi:hypothetical protein